MCGIVGKLSKKILPNDVKIVEKMRDSITHRGPDGYGIFHDEHCALGHRRLSIIDLSENGKQPFQSLDGRYTIVYNGEVYNYNEIKKKLIDKYEFISSSDTEVVLYSYIEYGADCLNLFNGMFAFAIWDSVSKQLFMARDRLGEKPLYFYNDHLKFYFSSELRAFSEVLDVNLKVSYEGLNQFLALGYTLSPKTIYEDIYQIEAGKYLIVNAFGEIVKHEKYWFYEKYFEFKHNLTHIEKLTSINDLLELSVKRRMTSDVPVGSFLSGGVDSSIVTSLMNKLSRNPIYTFSIGFGNSNFDESEDARIVAKYLNTVHSEKSITMVDCKNYINFGIKNMDGVLADNSFLPMLAVSDLASKKVKVVLSGDGGDELFGGYITYKSDLLFRYFSKFPKVLLSFLAKRRQVDRNKKIGMDFKVQQFAYGSLFNYRRAHYSWRLIFRPDERIKILGKQFTDLVHDTDPFKVFNKYYENVNHLDIMDQHFFVDAMTWMTDDILTKVDRASMQYSVETRAAFLDHELVQFAAGIPWNEKLDFWKTKKILKKTYSARFPDKIFNKKKSGFNFPIGNYIPNTYYNEFQDYCFYLMKRKLN